MIIVGVGNYVVSIILVSWCVMLILLGSCNKYVKQLDNSLSQHYILSLRALNKVKK